MGEQHYYQYAFARPDCSVRQAGAGVDPRFEVELVRNGSIAAVASRVGLDRFDVRRLQAQTAEDLGWLKQVAVRHNEIVSLARLSSPVLPLRLGTVFRSRQSLLAAAARREKAVADFLDALGDRQEWAVKLYLGRHRLEEVAGHRSPPPPHRPLGSKTGAEYLKQRKSQLQARRELPLGMQGEIQAVEHALSSRADRYCRAAPLGAALTGRREKMVFHAAFLLPPSRAKTWLATAGRLREAAARKGLLLEVTGPWPPYHFCPAPEW